MQISPLNSIDFYKTSHRAQYETGIQEVYSNFTARSGKLGNVHPDNFNGVVFFGLQHFILDFLMKDFNDMFFNQPKATVVAQYKRRLDNALGKGSVAVDHIEALHDLGYLPIEIRALPEGTVVPIGVPMLTIRNTHPEFFWLTNYLETVLSNSLWKPITSATTAHYYRMLLDKCAIKTGADLGFCQFQGHDFSCRGMGGMQDAALSGAAHLISFAGTDTVAAIDLLEYSYGANSDDDLIGCSVPATEHSVTSAGGPENEKETLRRIIQDVHPSGIVSLVADTYDLFSVICNYAAELKPLIMSRNGKVVFRPDSGDPVLIITGDENATSGSPERKGVIECLWDIFGGTVNEKGYKVLDSHVGAIYGDSITYDRARSIMQRLEEKGFASSNIVFGIGSYTYQYCTRDTWGMAVKSTYCIINGKGRDIYKDPITDNGTKKSLRGRIVVVQKDGRLVANDRQSDYDCHGNMLQVVFKNGTLIKMQDLVEIRDRLATQRANAIGAEIEVQTA